MTRVSIIGGGPGGYEAALVARQLGADVTLFDNWDIGGASVLTDCVPSKALIVASEAMTSTFNLEVLGMHPSYPTFELDNVNKYISRLASSQSHDIKAHLLRDGVKVIRGDAKLDADKNVLVGDYIYPSDVVLLATGARPRILSEDLPDSERILTWRQLLDLRDLPEHLIVVGSGVTGAEFAFAYVGLRTQVTLISSRERVLPGEDPDAAEVIEKVFFNLGGRIMPKTRAKEVRLTDDGQGVIVTLTNGEEVSGSHVLITIGGIPNTELLGLTEAGIKTDKNGFIEVDKVSRTNVPGIYAAGDCTGVWPLASIAAMQGRIAMRHALGDAVTPLDLGVVSATVFTTPEIATVGLCKIEEGSGVTMVNLPLATNPRAKMEKIENGFVKLFARNGTIVGAVICAPKASEMIHSITLAVNAKMSAEQLSQAFTIYPSLSGTIAEAARLLR